ncbi:MAG: EAL domain-containing protein [Thiobacillus sp.]|nr:EAL domain-containing protein [Thiobacillus sp.]
MQWLLGQRDIDAALQQVNALLAPITQQLGEQRQQRRARQLDALGSLTFDTLPFASHWCLIRHDGLAIPYEILGQHNGSWACIDRSATDLVTLQSDRLLQEIERGLIEETCSFDQPFLARIADATLAAGLHAVHTFTWQDPASGCLRRAALIDELERRLAHPVTEPPLFCALVEIPTMRPGRADLPGDELAVLQKQTGELLLATLENGEHCGRLSDISFLMIFSPQDPARLATRLSQLKSAMEALHPAWKMSGAVVPLADGETGQTPSHTLRRVNLACVPARQTTAFDLSCLSQVAAPSNRIEPLPFSALYLRCQKIAACDPQSPAHYEILLGIDEDLRPRHTTQSFVVMAEQSGLAHDLDAWVLRSALEWMDRRTGEGEQLSLSVNLSGNSLTTEGHIDVMLGLLARYPQLARNLILEITETAAIDNLEVAVRSLRQLRKLGCRIALDDFGSGYSSYSYLRSLPLDYLKIDGTYIRNLLTDPTDQALTASMVDVAHALGLKVVAEYVDSEAVYVWLKNLGVDYVQGYWVHAPERLDDLVLA